MYDAEINERRLFKAEQGLGFKLTRYEPGDSIDRAAAIIRKYDPRARRWKNPPNKSEHEFILNERTLCRHDFPYYTRYCHVIDKESGLVPYRPYKAQWMLNEFRAEHERAGIAMEFFNLKARQLGVSTDSEMVVSHRAQFGKYLYCLVASADPDKSKTMSEMMIRNWKAMPFFLMPDLTSIRSGEEIQFGNQDVTIAIEWLNQKSGLARGQTPHVAHVSEVSMCEDPEDKIDASLMRAMHPSAKLYAMYESTANGQGNWYHDTWKTTKKEYAARRSRLRPVFLPWFVGDDKYPTPAWLRAQPIPSDWKPHELTIRHAERAAVHVKNTPYLWKRLGLGWKMPVEQMWFWECTRETHRRNKTLNVFYQELCSDDIEAFQLALTSVFDTEQIALFLEHQREPLQIWGLRASPDVIPPRNQPQDYEVEKGSVRPGNEPRTLTCPNGQKFDMVPINYEQAKADPMGKIFIWEEAKPGNLYGIGCDPGHGVGEDRSVIEVMRKSTIARCPGLVAEYANDRIGASDMLPFAYALGVLYTTTVEDYLRQPKFVVAVDTSGDTLMKALIRLGMTNQHIWVTYDRYGRQITNNPRLGVLGVHWFREKATEKIVKSLRDYLIEVDSPWFLEEMGTLGYDPGKDRYEASAQAHDDRFMAAAYVHLSLHVDDPEPANSAFGLRKIEAEVPIEQRYARFPGDAFASSLPLGDEMRAYMDRFMGGAPPRAPQQASRVSYIKTKPPAS